MRDKKVSLVKEGSEIIIGQWKIIIMAYGKWKISLVDERC